jgi:hypothetical protein
MEENQCRTIKKKRNDAINITPQGKGEKMKKLSAYIILIGNVGEKL